MSVKKRTHAELASLAKQAKKLLLEHRLEQKAIAVKLGVSEKTISTWVQKYGWKKQKQDLLKAEINAGSNGYKGIVNLNAFAEYLQGTDPKLYKKLLEHIIGFTELQAIIFKTTVSDGTEAKQ